MPPPQSPQVSTCGYYAKPVLAGWAHTDRC